MTTGAGPRRLARRLLISLLMACGLLIAGATAASAHAQLDLTSPAAATTVSTAPAAVLIQFSEDVAYSDRSIRVLDGTGISVTSGHVGHPRGRPDMLSVGLRPGLPAGSYSVTWRAVSADSHPVSGTFTFGIRAPAGPAPAAAATAGSTTVGVLDGMIRLLEFTGLSLLLGAWFFALVIEPAANRRTNPGTLARRGWTLTAVSTVAAYALGGAYQNGLPLTAAFDPAALVAEVGTRYGQLALVRLAILLLIRPVVGRLTHPGQAAGERNQPPTSTRTPKRGNAFDAGGLSLALLVTFSFAEHAGTGRQLPLALLSNTIHLGAACVWVGGLIVLAVRLRRPATTPAPKVLARWSQTALLAVAALAVTGTYQAWRDIGSLPAMTSTPYGRLLLAKLGLFVTLLALGNRGRHAVLHILRDRVTAKVGNHSVLATLRLSVAAEVTVALGALAVTAVLIDATPAREAYNPPTATTLAAHSPGRRDLSVAASADTSRPGTTRLSLEAFTPDGQPETVTAAVATLTDDNRRYPPRPFGYSAGPQGATALLTVPAGGTWTVTFTLTIQSGRAYTGLYSWHVL